MVRVVPSRIGLIAYVSLPVNTTQFLRECAWVKVLFIFWMTSIALHGRWYHALLSAITRLMLQKRQLHVLPCLLSQIFPHQLTHTQTHRENTNTCIEVRWRRPLFLCMHSKVWTGIGCFTGTYLSLLGWKRVAQGNLWSPDTKWPSPAYAWGWCGTPGSRLHSNQRIATGARRQG